MNETEKNLNIPEMIGNKCKIWKYVEDDYKTEMLNLTKKPIDFFTSRIIYSI